jgi:hypothetical protein
MPAVRATLIIASERTLGWLTNEHAVAVGEVVLVLDTDLDRALRSDDLPPNHRIELHGDQESVQSLLLLAGLAGFTVVWPPDDTTPGPSKN